MTRTPEQGQEGASQGPGGAALGLLPVKASVRLGPAGLELREPLAFPECVALGREILRAAEGCAWALGDLAAYVDVTYGGRELQQWAEAVGIAYETARRYRYVARRFGNGTRVPHLTHRHHLIVAPRADRQDLLALAAEHQWSAGALHRHVQELEAREGTRELPWLRCTDVWNIAACDPRFGIPYPGRIPGQIVANTLYYFAPPGALVVDPMAGGGVTLDVCRAMDRRCIAFDLEPARPDILQADALEPWPMAEPADLVFLDPPYWSQREDAYGGLARAASYEAFLSDLLRVLDRAAEILRPSGVLAVLLAPMAVKVEHYRDTIIDLASSAERRGWRLLRRFHVPVGSQQVGPQVMAHCKAEKVPVALLRDLLVFGAPPGGTA